MRKIPKVTMKEVTPGALLYQIHWSGAIEQIKIYGPVVDRAVAYEVQSNNGRFRQMDKLFVGDMGIRPLNYDDRCTQLFFSADDAMNAKILWDGANPNFLDESFQPLSR